jgi:hypothetical protein
MLNQLVDRSFRIHKRLEPGFFEPNTWKRHCYSNLQPLSRFPSLNMCILTFYKWISHIVQLDTVSYNWISNIVQVDITNWISHIVQVYTTQLDITYCTSGYHKLYKWISHIVQVDITYRTSEYNILYKWLLHIVQVDITYRTSVYHILYKWISHIVQLIGYHTVQCGCTLYKLDTLVLQVEFRRQKWLKEDFQKKLRTWD